MLVTAAVIAGVVLTVMDGGPRPATVAAAQPVSADIATGSLPYPPSRLPRPPRLTPSPVAPPSPSAVPRPPAKPVTARPASSHTTAPPAAPYHPAYYSVSAQQRLINQDRARYGLRPLAWSSCLYNVALSNARRMAAQGYISHANGVYQDLACGLGHQSGENVGYYSLGVDDSLLNTEFMNSPDHRANILGPYRYVATAWAVAPNGYAYIAVEFD